LALEQNEYWEGAKPVILFHSPAHPYSFGCAVYEMSR